MRAVALGDGTSRCIGRPVTALCAVETDLACYARLDIALCETAWIDFSDRGWFPQFAPRPGRVQLYQVTGARLARDAWPEGPLGHLLPSDTQIGIVWRECDDRGNKCTGAFTATYDARQLAPGRWALVDAGRSQYGHFYVDENREPKLRLVRDDPDLYSIRYAGAVPKPDLRTRPKPRDARTLVGAFPPDPKGVLRAIDFGWSTSRCIGQAVTALCAVETHQACFTRADNALCSLVGDRRDLPPYRLEPSFYTQTFFRMFRVLTAREVGPGDVADFGELPPYGKVPRLVGDSVIDIIELNCWRDADYCFTSEVVVTYTLRRIGLRRWQIVDRWHTRFRL